MIRIRRTLLLGLVLSAPVLFSAQPPSWLAPAIDRLPEEIAPDLAYTVEIEHNGQRSSERYDPSRPAGSRWTLLSRQGRSPTEAEFTEYARQRNGPSTSAYRASFRRDQVDLSSARVLEESATHATVHLGFNAIAKDADKMLRHLELTLDIQKQPARITSYRLQLAAPYSPVIGVKMHALDAGAEFDGESRPQRSWSRFRGRIFLKLVDESIEAHYADYALQPRVQ